MRPMQVIDDDLLSDLDDCRAIRGEVGLIPFKVFVRIREWSGERQGDGSEFRDGPDLQITVGKGKDKQPVRVRMTTNKDIIASGGIYRDRDLRVGPITPDYGPDSTGASGGFGQALLDPSPKGDTTTEIFWRVEGGDMAPGGSWYEKIGQETTALHTYVMLRSTGTKP